MSFTRQAANHGKPWPGWAGQTKRKPHTEASTANLDGARESTSKTAGWFDFDGKCMSMPKEGGGKSISQRCHFSESIGKGKHRAAFSDSASSGYVISKPVQGIQFLWATGPTAMNGFDVHIPMACHSSTWKWHRNIPWRPLHVLWEEWDKVRLVMDLHKWISRFRRLPSLTLTPSTITLEIREFREEWEFILHHH